MLAKYILLDGHVLIHKPKVILFVVNAAEFFLSHRLPLAVAAKAAGYEVHVAAAYSPHVERIRALGYQCHIVSFVRSGQGPFNELRTLIQLVWLFRHVKPDLVHLITIKPVLYGGIAARITGVGAVISAVSGLGTVFVANSLAARLRRWLVIRLYVAAFRQKRLAVIFQNPDDRDTLLAADCLRTSEVRMIRGAGVALEDYPYLPEPEGKTVVVMVARLLKDKGVLEFVDAAKILHQRGVDVQIRLIGSLDQGNPTSVTEQDLNVWRKENVVEVLGFREDIAEQYAASNIVCLPSYREGLPKSLVEAAACGRAVVTTDVPGCRDAITPDVTGLLVPAKDAFILANAIQKLVENPKARKRMGLAGRLLAEEAFAIGKIVEQHMAVYRELLSDD